MAFDFLPVRLAQGQDLRRALEDTVAAQGCTAAYVVSGIGSLIDAMLRRAGAPQAELLPGNSELLTLGGSVSHDSSHVHATLADASGAVLGGHLSYGCTVRTSAEVLLALVRDWEFSRAFDANTSFDELMVTPVTIPERVADDDDGGDPDALRLDDEG